MVDIEAIKRKLQQLNGQKGNSFKDNYWKVKKPGEYMVRVVPWQDTKGQPFKEMWYYKGIGRKSANGYGPFPMPTRKQFKHDDPIQDLIDLLRKEDQEGGTDKNKDMLKRLYPKMTAYIPIIVRGEEDKGVRLWPITDLQMLYPKLLGYFVDEQVLQDTTDYTDVNNGFDIKVTVVESKRMFNGKPVLDSSVELARKVSPLSKDKKQIDAWIAAIPKLEELEPEPSFDDMKKRLEEWLADGGVAASTSEGTERGSPAADGGKDLDKLSEELKVTEKKAEPEAEKPKVAPKKASTKKVENVEDELERQLAELEGTN